jgi:hypothetical protein
MIPLDPLSLSRREFVGRSALGVGTLALGSLLNPNLFAAATPKAGLHFAPKAKRIIWLTQSGAPSQQDLFDYKPFETWSEEGARDTQTLASERVKKMLGDYVQPVLDEGKQEELDAFVATRKAAMPDMYV